MNAKPFVRALLISNLCLCGCKLEPLQRLEPSDPVRAQWSVRDYQVPDSRPQSQAARELASYLIKSYQGLAGLQDRSQLPDAKAPIIRFLSAQFGQAMLAPDGDNRGWTQAVPLRRLQNKTWEIAMSLREAPRASNRSKKADPAPQRADQDAKHWAFRQFRDTGGAPERFDLLRLTPALLEEPGKLRQRARGRFVLLDATQEDHESLRAQLLEPGSSWLASLAQLGAVGCSVFTSLGAQDPLWEEIAKEFQRPFVELLAPGEAPPQRVEILTVANAVASRSWQAWHGGEVKTLGPERAGQGPIPKLLVRPANPIDRRGQVQVTMSGDATWETQHSVLGRLPGILRPEKAVVVLARWNHSGVSEASAIQNPPSDAAVSALLGLMRRTFQWREQGRRSDISILYGAIYGGSNAKDAGLAQFLRLKTIRPENIRAVIWLEDFSTRNDTIDIAVQSNRLPEGWPQLLELYGGHHMQIPPPSPLAADDPLQSLAPFEVPVLTFTQAPWLDEPEPAGGATPPTLVPMAEQIEKILQFAWTLTESQEEPVGAASGANPKP